MSELAELRARIPKIDCQRRCWRTCGPIPMGMAELAAVRRASAPLAVPIAVEENGVAMMAVGGSFTCPQLSPLRDCHVYDERPIICRLYGVVEDLPCAWGCVPERWLTRQEAAAIIEAAVTARRPQGSADG